jgi:hypothetical protein
LKIKKEREKWKDGERNNLKGFYGRLNTLGKMLFFFQINFLIFFLVKVNMLLHCLDVVEIPLQIL